MGTLQEDLDALDAQLAELNKVLDHKLKQDGDDDGNGNGDYDDQLDAMAHDSGSDDDNNDNGDDDDDDDGIALSTTNNRKRMLNPGRPLHYQPDLEKAYGDNASSGSPLPVTHRWEALVQNLAAEHGVPLSTASVMARKQYPRLWVSYQQSGLQGNASSSHQQLVATEMAKGLSREIAEQRVMHAHGSAPLDLNKCADSPVVRFMRTVDTIMKRQRQPRLTRVEAMRKARLTNPRLFGRYQNT
jgi:hypothetical protein